MIQIEWSSRKNRINVIKHRIDFSEAAAVFDDPLHLTIYDPDHSFEEHRFITIGRTVKNKLIIVAHTFEDDKIRMITARKPTRAERKSYEE